MALTRPLHPSRLSARSMFSRFLLILSYLFTSLRASLSLTA